jgi:SEC-C motif-containing protein
MKAVTANCKLCNSSCELRESHFYPKFVVRWLKETGTGYLRNPEKPNERRQDGPKEYWLCDACEQRFSVSESYFAQTIFYPHHNSKAMLFAFDERLFYYLISVLWRTLIRHLDDHKREKHFFLKEILQAENEWRQLLLGKAATTTFDEIHLFIAGIAENPVMPVSYFNMYCARSLDSTVASNDVDTCFVYTNLARFICVAHLTPIKKSDWVGTRVTSGCGHLALPQEINDGQFGAFLISRAKLSTEAYNIRATERTKRLIEEHTRKNMPRITGSDLGRVVRADHAAVVNPLVLGWKAGRNDLCPCGSGIKFKRCHGAA